MFKSILKLKHWVFFVLVYALPTLIQIFQMQSFASSIQSMAESSMETENPDIMLEAMNNSFMSIFSMFPLMMIIPFIVLAVWLLAVGFGLKDKLPENLKMNTSIYAVAIVVSFALSFSAILLFINFMQGMFTEILNQSAENLENFIPDFSPMITGSLMYFVSFFFFVYIVYFAAKTIKMAETQKNVTFGDFVGEFFLIVFFPIGVWILQPRINKLVDETAKVEAVEMT